ncbi:acetolactate synthase, large subunit, biosynthetic type [Desulfofarcimen acetoxidans DSM 771]|uniref:Acetolactate synthase n=1 Tax=Desulfofarcimen acetoxidans (strain ATCC 49208 / DSM 771 / KCTC 5769 / VKM B-1644 / 5575) TaxID=485916 RepID=C8W659_DESAS|nr:biosynthetic-type acetolactate synthase large subunit [Desulfofarcimen acetoxidans]ACV61514.1 acetolactate synthase, large subunit, biosynthetic type [Desulfofarcimen acetoxidans DSM 771]
MGITVAEALVLCLERENVEVIFGYPGGAILPVYDALYKSNKIKHVLVRHEQGAAHAADGYARATGKVGVCMATSGPGATNLVTGIANAYMDSVPIVAFTGQVPTGMVGTDAFQEVDITGITMPVVKHNYFVKDPKQVPKIVREAFYIARTGRPGPVLIDLPKDVTSAIIDYEEVEEINLRGYKPNYRADDEQVEKAAEMIKKSQCPVIYAGGGVVSAGAHDELKVLAETIGAPVTHTLLGLGGFPGDHPLFAGMLGLHGAMYANKIVTECDLLITLGARFDDRVTGKIAGFAPDASVIHVDIDPAEIGKNVRVHLPVAGDVKTVIQQIIPLLEQKNNRQWLERFAELKKQYALRYEPAAGEGLKPQQVIEKLNEVAQGNAIICTDVGQHQMWAAHYYRHIQPRSFISSGGLGTMGYGYPAAIGAEFGCPGKQVILISGDGSFQMNLQEMATVMEQGLSVKVIVLNNGRLGMVRQLQEFYCDKRYMAVDFSYHPDFAGIARVYGMKGFDIKTSEELNAILPEVLSSQGPAIINCFVQEDENVYPMVMAGKCIDEAIEG